MHIPSYHSPTATHLSFPLPRPKSIIPPLSPAALTEWQTPHGGCAHSTYITLTYTQLIDIEKNLALTTALQDPNPGARAIPTDLICGIASRRINRLSSVRVLNARVTYTWG
jgi:hypothetical protein